MRFKTMMILILVVAAGYFGMHYLIGNEGGEYTVVGSISSNMGSQMKQSYDSFEGTKYRTIAIVKGTEFHLKALIKTESGSLTLSFIDPNGEVLYSESNPEGFVEVNIPIVTSGEYRLQVEGEHQGSYSLDWAVRILEKVEE
ncbi:hypothetical protein SANA_13480 [Gottschalkiaceae bacterium SANA]|nr:hypothetical protein SANA_13480 [Gottschalkiaceae bacterium SANA]